jgi:hypothetical protein
MDGTCGNVKGGMDPNQACSVGTTGVCNGMDACSCMDNMRNFGETDVDCGGPNCPQCPQGKKCMGDNDCATGHCSGGVCCDQDCNAKGVCWSCNLMPNWVGRCEAVVIGNSYMGCMMGHACNGSQMCISTGAASNVPNGAMCGGPGECISGNCGGSPMTCRPAQPSGAICINGGNCVSTVCQADFTCQ